MKLNEPNLWHALPRVAVTLAAGLPQKQFRVQGTNARNKNTAKTTK